MPINAQSCQDFLQVVDSAAQHWMALWVTLSSRQASALAHWLQLHESLLMAVITSCGRYGVVNLTHCNTPVVRTVLQGNSSPALTRTSR